MRVLGIDPGSRNTGLGIVDTHNKTLSLGGYETIKMGNDPLPQRLGIIFAGVCKAIEQFQPDIVAVEQVFVSNNAHSALILGHARGSAIAAAVHCQQAVAEYTALQIKQAVVGTGGADKRQVQHMVRVLLGLTKTPGTDEADALACAICHIHTEEVNARIRAAV